MVSYPDEIAEQDRPSPKRPRLTYFVVALNILVVAAAILGATTLYYANRQVASINRLALDDALVSVRAEPGARVLNVLLVGSDSASNLSSSDPIRIGREGQRLADVVIIAHLDERSGEMALLSIPRDTWVEIPGLDRSSRINSTFATGGADQLIETIEHNFDIPIHHFVNVDFAGFEGLVEAVGSVTIHFPTPARDLNTLVEPPVSQTGFSMPFAGCQTLDPEESLAYVRSRHYQTQRADGTWRSDLSSDLGRIQRQQDFLRQLLNRGVELSSQNPLVLNDLISASLENVVVDESLNPAIIRDLVQGYSSFEPGQLQTFSLPVVNSVEEGNQVLIAAPQDAEPLLEIFRGAEFSDLETIRVSVLSDDGISEELDSIFTGLGLTYQLADLEGRDRLEDTYILRHGPDGLPAAQLVAANLPFEVSFEESGLVVGRNVEIIEPAVPAQEADSPSQQVEVTPQASTTVARVQRNLAQSAETTAVLPPLGPTLNVPIGPNSSICQ